MSAYNTKDAFDIILSTKVVSNILDLTLSDEVAVINTENNSLLEMFSNVEISYIKSE